MVGGRRQHAPSVAELHQGTEGEGADRVLLLGREPGLGLVDQQRIRAQLLPEEGEVAGRVGQRREQRGQLGIEQRGGDVLVPRP